MGYFFGIQGETDNESHFGFSYTFFADLEEFSGGSPSCRGLAEFVLSRITDEGPGIVKCEDIPEFLSHARKTLGFFEGRERFMKTADPDLGMVSYLVRVIRTMMKIASASLDLRRDIEIG